MAKYLVSRFERDNQIKSRAIDESSTVGTYDGNDGNKSDVKDLLISGESTRVDPGIELPEHAKKRLRNEGERMLDELDREQFKALEEFWKTEVELSINSASTGSPPLPASGSSASLSTDYRQAEFEANVQAVIRVPIPPFGHVEYDAFTYTHRIDWEYIPGETVDNFIAICTGSGGWFNYARWSYEGDEDQVTAPRAGGNFFISDSTGVFDRCTVTSVGGGWTCIATDRMYTRTAGNWNGTGALTREELNPE
ncbi:hypothetical protein [Halovivax gelatinilyticus]|uniref:hypothetical protein n=1 Tax=Halovivax gelatinilyticus TaxID=2961597 RepID=UPI0020CA5E4A|nr:hypothetical protein [Halovivax gelatinilyticus]